MSNNPMLNIAKDFDRISEAPLKRFEGLLLGRFATKTGAREHSSAASGRFATKPHSSARHLPFPMPLRTTLVCMWRCNTCVRVTFWGTKTKSLACGP